MDTRSSLTLVVGFGLMLAFGWLLIRHWHHRPLRLRLLGNILLVALFPAFVFVPSHDLALIFAVGGTLLIGGLALRIVAERAERNVSQ